MDYWIFYFEDLWGVGRISSRLMYWAGLGVGKVLVCWG